MFHRVMEYIRESMEPSGRKSHYYIIYTAAFLLLFVICFWPYLSTGTSFIWSGDGWEQHYKAMVYYWEYLRNILSGIFHLTKTGIPDWDFNIGEGNGILNTFHYYVIGDPFAFFCVLVPKGWLPYYYSFSCVLRIYLGGAAFSALCFYAGHKKPMGILTGALSYAFCMWGLMNIARHPYFLNPLIIFPLMILGVEKILRKERPVLYLAVVATAALSNFYFFYMYVILLGIYIVVRLIFFCGKDIKKGLALFGRLSLCSVIGSCMGAVILLPVLGMLFSDSRRTLSQPFHLLYSWDYYSVLPAIGVSSSWNYWLLIGFSTPVFLALFLFFGKRKQDLFLKTLFVILVLIMLFPIGGRALNGFSYMTNRWCFALALLGSFILSKYWEDLLSVDQRKMRLLFLCCSGYYVLILLLDRSRTKGALTEIVLFFILLFLLREVEGEWKRQTAVLLVGAISLILTAAYHHSLYIGNGYVDSCVRYRDIAENWENNEAVALREYAEEDFVRGSGRNLTYNANLFSGISSSNYFWTLSNPCVNDFRRELALREPIYQRYEGYDDRTALLALSAVNYYTIREEDLKILPFGYEPVWEGDTDPAAARISEEISNHSGVAALSEPQQEKIKETLSDYLTIYRNEYALPPAYLYEQVIPENVWNDLDPVQKQEAMLSAAYVKLLSKSEDSRSESSIDLSEAAMSLPESVKTLSLSAQDLPVRSLSYTSEPRSKEVTVAEGRVVTTAKNTKVTLTPEEPVERSEIYVAVTGLRFSDTKEYELYFGDPEADPFNLYDPSQFQALTEKEQFRIKKEMAEAPVVDKNAVIRIALTKGGTKDLEYAQEDAIPSSSRHDFVVNLGYYEASSNTITLTFVERGIYTFDSLKVYAVPMDDFAQRISDRKKEPVQDLTFGTDRVDMTTSTEGERILCLATSCDKGWSVTIDGTKAQLLCVNDRYCGVLIPSGKHRVCFTFRLPYKKAGAFMTLAGLAGAVAVGILPVRSKKKKKERESREGQGVLEE